MRRLQALGVADEADATCANCGERRVECLELHHVAGRYFADETVILCANCHRCVSDPAEDQKTPKEAIPEIRFLQGWRDLLEERIRHLQSRALA